MYGRGWRIIPDELDAKGNIIRKAPVDQFVYVIGPDAPRKARVVEKLRRESDEALIEREQKSSAQQENAGQQRFGETKWAKVGAGRAQSMDPAHDVSPAEFPELAQKQREYGLGAAPMTGLKGFLQSYGIYPSPDSHQPSTRQVELTERQIKDDLRREIRTLAGRADSMLIRKGRISPDENGQYRTGKHTYTQMKIHFGAGIDNRTSLSELRSRLEWLRNVWLPSVEQL